jgi:hypothetical protein
MQVRSGGDVQQAFYGQPFACNLPHWYALVLQAGCQLLESPFPCLLLAAASKLSTDEYPFVATPSSPSGSRTSLPSSADNTPKAGVSVRSVRTTGGWAKKNSGSPEKPEMGKVGGRAGRRADGWVGEQWGRGRLAGICAWPWFRVLAGQSCFQAAQPRN